MYLLSEWTLNFVNLLSYKKKKSFPHRGPKIIIKMSSLLNVSNDSSKSDEFNLN